MWCPLCLGDSCEESDEEEQEEDQETDNLAYVSAFKTVQQHYQNKVIEQEFRATSVYEVRSEVRHITVCTNASKANIKLR